MKKVTSQNNNLLCSPLVKGHAVAQGGGSLPLLGNSSGSTGVAALTVLAEGEIVQGQVCGEWIHPGDTVYVRFSGGNPGWNEKKLRCPDLVDKDGKMLEFVLVPASEVVFVARNPEEPEKS